MNFGIKKVVLACGLGAMVSLAGLSAAIAQPEDQPACEQGQPCEKPPVDKKQSPKDEKRPEHKMKQDESKGEKAPRPDADKKRPGNDDKRPEPKDGKKPADHKKKPLPEEEQDDQQD